MYASQPYQRFAETNISDVPEDVWSVAIGDANNDGQQDVVIGIRRITTGDTLNEVRMYENKTGKWVETNISDEPYDTNSVAIGDANNDGQNEVVIGIAWSIANPVRMYENKSGGWVETYIGEPYDGVNSLAIGDANNDGKNEVVVGLFSGTVMIYENVSGGWVETDIVDLPTYVRSVAIGDANNDGKNDVVVVTNSDVNELRMYENKSGDWVETNISDEPDTVNEVTIGDANRDGQNEVVIGITSGINVVRMYKNTTGTWVETNISNTPTDVRAVAIGDTNKDGQNEVVVGMFSTYYEVTMYENKTGGWVETNISRAPSALWSVAIGDANRDGQNEVVIGMSSTTNEVRMYGLSSNPLSCGNLTQGQTCQLSWVVNATGTFGAQYWLDANFTSDNVNVSANDSGNFQVNITYSDITPPNIAAWAFNVSNMTNYSSSQGYQFNATVIDATGVSYVWVEQNFNGTMTNVIVGSCGGNVYCYNVSSLAAGYYYMKWYANDTSGNKNLNNSDYVHYYQVNKSWIPITLYINGTNGDKTLFNNSAANFTANFTTGYNFQIGLYTNFSHDTASSYEGFEGSWLPSGWETGGSAVWHQNSTEPINGTYSAASGDIDDDQMSWIDVTKTYTRDGNISFNWSVSSESWYDNLCFCMDKACGSDNCTCANSGTADALITSTDSGDWTNGSVVEPVSQGPHTFTWCYAKDGSASYGADMGKIDNVVFNWTYAPGDMIPWDSQNSPLMNYTDLAPYAAGNYSIVANWTGNQNYTSSQASHILNLNVTVQYGWLNVSYQSPTNGSSQNLLQYGTFNVSMNVTCVGGSCGNVTGVLRYNASAGLNPDTNVSATAGAVPFYASTGNPPRFLGTSIAPEIWSQINSVKIGDANNDGKMDVVLGPNDYQLQMYENKTGTWVNTTIAWNTDSDIYSIAIGDANNDGQKEVVTGATHGAENLLMYKNTSGTWVKTIINNTAWSIYSVAIGDANNDGKNEVVIGNDDYNTTRMYENKSGGWVETNISSPGDEVDAIAVGDADNDGQNEVVVGVYSGTINLRMYKNTTGKWVETNISDGLHTVYSVTIGDANNDGSKEIVISGSSNTGNETRMYENKSGGWVETNFSDVLTDIYSAIGDVNNDGKNEIVIGTDEWQVTNWIMMYENKTGGWVETNISNVPVGVYSLAVGDANNDGRDEVVSGLGYNDNDDVWVYQLAANPLSCGSLIQGQTCTLSWTVNATGTPPVSYWLDSNFTSNYSSVSSNDSGNFQVNITSGAITVSPISPANGTIVDRDSVDASTADVLNLTVYTTASSTVNITFKANLTSPSIGGQTNLVLGYNTTNSSGGTTLYWDPNVSYYAGNYTWWAESNVSYTVNGTKTVLVYGGFNLTFQSQSDYPNASYSLGDMVKINSTLKSLGPESALQLNSSYLARVNSTIIAEDSTTRDVNQAYWEALAGNWTGNYTLTGSDPLSGNPYNVSLNATANYFFTNTTNFTRAFDVLTNVTVSITLYGVPVDYTSLDPGITSNASTIKGFPMIVSVDSITNVNVNISIKSNETNMTGPNNNYIMVQNQTFADNSQGQNNKSLTTQYQLLKSNIPVNFTSGTNVSAYWWVAIPSYTPPGLYTNSIIVYSIQAG
jgi:hypothetical protein